MKGKQHTVCHSVDPVKSMVHKLAEVVKNSPEALRHDLEGLTNDLEKIPAAGLTDEQVKVWVKQVQELIYDFEDWQLESKVGAWQISKFKDLIRDSRDRYARYNLLKKALATDACLVNMYPSSSKAQATSDDPPLLWGERPILIGIDGPKRELIQNHLKDDKKSLTVLSILGVGGLGKTTLAKEIYGDLLGQFSCKASVFLGRNPSMKKILLDIIRQVNHPEYHYGRSALSETDERLLISQILEFLEDRRYLILIDDIHSTWAWKFLNCAFPDSRLGSRILLTTQMKDVAESCALCPSDVIYQMKAISSEDSRTLLDRKISLPENERLSGFKEVSDRMLKMCRGVPLAIIITAGLLRSKSIMLDRLNFQLLGQNYSTTQYIRKILDITFADMSWPMKCCFLYLTTFPANFIIQKDHLIQKWVAEGLLQKSEGKSIWETGESYFDELIARRLIETICGYYDDEVVGCTFHSEIYDFIASVAKEENFITSAAELVSGPFPCNTIRRYSVHYNDEAETLVSSTVHLSSLRHLTILCCGTVHDLSVFKLLQVLDLKYTSFSYEIQRHIRCLSRLRYLAHGSSADMNQAIKVEVGGLEHLETLDVSGIWKAQFSVSIYRLPKLVSIIGKVLLLPAFNESMGMLNWEEVSTRIECQQQCDTMAELLAKSERLKTLHLNYNYHFQNQAQKILPLCNIKLCKLESLFIEFSHGTILAPGWTPSPCLRSFVLKNSIHRVPDTWELLVNLTHLDIIVDEVGAGDVFVLGKLPNLASLKLYSQGYDKNELVNVYPGSFQSLKVAWFKCLDDGMGLQFINGTMPVLQRLRLDFNEKKTRELYGRKFDFGIRFPSCLNEVHITINCRGSTNEDVSDAEGAIIDQISDNINNPRLHLRRVGPQFMHNKVDAPWSEGKDKSRQSCFLRSP